MSNVRRLTTRQPSTADFERELDMVNLLQAMNGIQSEFVAVVRGMQVNGILWSGLAQIDANGTWGHNFAVPYAYVHVYNLGTHSMTVSNDPLQGSPPPFGIGLKSIPAGAKFGFNLVGRHLAIYGTAADQANVEVHVKPGEPD